MNKKSSYVDTKFLLKNYYNSPKMLNLRLETWGKYGTNKKSMFEWIIEILKTNTKLTPFQNYLDVGCGSGNLIEKIIKNRICKNIVAIDISEKMLSLVKTKANKLKTNIKTVCCDINTVSLNDNFFDLITATHMLYHINNKENCLKKLKNLLKINSKLLITTSVYDFDSGFNKYHYEGLDLFNFPKEMKDKTLYSSFSGDTAIKIVKRIFPNSVEIYTYENNLKITDINNAMSYYMSAMIFRQSNGLDDERISNSQWEDLKNYVHDKITNEIKEKGFFFSSGKVILIIATKK